MKRIRFRPFWSYDVIKTQEWLNSQSNKGYQLDSFNTVLRLFVFSKGEKFSRKHIINYGKGIDGCPDYVSSSNDYNEIYHTKNFCILEQIVEEPEYFPSYDQLLSRNQKIKYVSGIILLIQIFLAIAPISLILISAISGNLTIESEPGGITTPETTKELLEGISVLFLMFMLVLGQGWLIYTFFKLRISNRQLVKLCGEDIQLSLSVPTNTIMSKEELKRLKKEKMIVRKMRPGWFYSPDKYAEWLETMELKGLNLIRMSKIGNSFYFLKGESKKVKYHVDYQLKKSPSYFKINEESGWKLFFTSVTRYFAISVWGQEYIDLEPEYYSDVENKIKHAKRFMMSYVIWLLPMSLMYFVMFGFSIYSFINIDFFSDKYWMIVTPTMFLLVGIEFLYFSVRLIRYYKRVKAFDC
jgi:hypothetical protein